MISRPLYKHSSKAAFSSAQFRQRPEAKSNAPGPADYRPNVDGSFERLCKEKNGSFMFKSQRQRFESKKGPTQPDYSSCTRLDQEPVHGDPRMLGPGSYSLGDEWKARKEYKWQIESAPFLSTDRRFESRNHSNKTSPPGPGQYRIASSFDGSIPGTNRDAGFTTTKRFAEKAAKIPGPGEYNVHSELFQKSFNVTFNSPDRV